MDTAQSSILVGVPPKGLIRRIREAIWDRFCREAHPEIWHRADPFLPVRLKSGEISDTAGNLWRRRTPAGWEFVEDPEAEDDWIERQI